MGSVGCREQEERRGRTIIRGGGSIPLLKDKVGPMCHYLGSAAASTPGIGTITPNGFRVSAPIVLGEGRTVSRWRLPRSLERSALAR
jgi:hypothetical protein